MPKCKICKHPFTPKWSTLEPTCQQYDCMVEYALEVAKKEREKKVKAEEKEWKDRKRLFKAESVGVVDLQKEINKLSRMIDSKFGYLCIDCGKPFGKQTDAAHFNSVGTNNSIRFNLHNLHSARSYCNQYDPNHKVGYKVGLEQRYGAEYLEYVESLSNKYPKMKFSNHLIIEWLKITRQIIRTFDEYDFKDGKEGRELFNKTIGIYLNEFKQ